MARTKISEFSATPGNNTDIDGINIAEGCAPSGINDAIRELMSQLKDFQAGTAGDSFNGPVGTTTAAAGAFTTLSASSTVSGTGFSNYLASPPAIGGTAAAAGSFTTLSASSTVTLSGGTANGVLYLNASKVATSGSALTFDGTNFATTGKSFGASFGVGTNLYAGIGMSGGGDNAYWRAYAVHIWQNATDPNAATTGTELMRLTSTGLKLGATSGGAKLYVYDAGNTYSGAFGSVGGAQIVALGNSSGVAAVQGFSNNAFAAYSDLVLQPGGGNLGLGVTPSAWGLGKAFEIGIAGNCVWGVQSADLRLGANMRYDGSNYRYVNNGVAARYDVANGTLGGHAWYTAASGTAGTAISFTQAMTLFASGGLSLGNTSDPGATNLSVTGTAKAGIVHLGGNYTAGATTPSVTGISYMPISNSSATTITNFTGAVTGQIIYLYFADANTTINRANARLAGSTNFTSTQYATLALLYNGTEWIEICRSTTNG